MSRLAHQPGENGSPAPTAISNGETLVTQPLLELGGVSKHYVQGHTTCRVLSEVSLIVHAGELVAVMGASGSGKSTLLNIAGSLTPPTSGIVSWSGDSSRSMSARKLAALRRQHIGFVFQDFNLLPSLTAAENAAAPLELDGWSRRDAEQEALQALESVGMKDRADTYPDDLSGGQRQRVAIARAIVGERRLILADEPTGALDTTTGDAVMRVLREQIDSGSGGLLVTHSDRHAQWADRIIVLQDGRIVRPSSPSEADDASRVLIE